MDRKTSQLLRALHAPRRTWLFVDADELSAEIERLETAECYQIRAAIDKMQPAVTTANYSPQ